MTQQLPTAAFIGKVFYIGECLFRQSHVPTPAAPPLSDEELHECDEIVVAVLNDPNKIDILGMLIRVFHIATPLEFVGRLAAINRDHDAYKEKSDDANDTVQYWYHIANTYSMLFVLQSVQERCEQEDLQEEIYEAWVCYDDAVASAKKIIGDVGNWDLIVELSKQLTDCKTWIEKALQRVEVPERR